MCFLLRCQYLFIVLCAYAHSRGRHDQDLRSDTCAACTTSVCDLILQVYVSSVLFQHLKRKCCNTELVSTALSIAHSMISSFCKPGMEVARWGPRLKDVEAKICIHNATEKA